MRRTLVVNVAKKVLWFKKFDIFLSMQLKSATWRTSGGRAEAAFLGAERVIDLESVSEYFLQVRVPGQSEVRP